MNQTYNEKASIRFLYFVSGDSLFLVISERFHYDSTHFENRMKLFNERVSEQASTVERASEASEWVSGASE